MNNKSQLNMKTSGTRYWAIRSDKDNIQLLFSELQQGRLRQGWGYDKSQDLRLLQAAIDKGGNWWAALTPDQRDALPNLRMLQMATPNDSIQRNDIVLIPNLPEYGLFCVVEVIGEYYFDPLILSEDQDINGLKQDYGHVLPVRLLTASGVHKYAEGVPASIRSTFKAQNRLWKLDKYKEDIDSLLGHINLGVALISASTGEARLERAWDAALTHATTSLQEKLGEELKARFQAAEWEEPIKIVIGNLYPGAIVQWVGGPAEMGADVIVQIPNHFGGAPWLVIIQVKNYSGELGSDVLTQLQTAYDHYSKDGNVLLLVVMTTADEISKSYINGSQSLENKLKIPIKAILKKQMMKLLSEGLLKKASTAKTRGASTFEL